MVLTLLPLLWKHGNLTLKLYIDYTSEKIATLNEGWLFIDRFKVGSLIRIINKNYLINWKLVYHEKMYTLASYSYKRMGKS